MMRLAGEINDVGAQNVHLPLKNVHLPLTRFLGMPL